MGNNLKNYKAKVSMLIPVYNSGEFIFQTIRSAVDQTWPYKEIIIVDDGSTDDSYRIACEF
jgi:glycosyltransferase involved in cell wall biosynthesis